MAGAQEQAVRFTAVGTTHVGKVREHNEDNFLAADLQAKTRNANGASFAGTLGTRGIALVVADGMGGAAAGEVASQMAVDTLHEALSEADLGGTIRSEPDVIGLLEGAINKANTSIFAKGNSSKEFQGMGTTMTAAVVLGDSLYLSQVGDSRGYILRKGKLVQMTRDQSLINQLIEDGTLTEEQAEHLGGKNIILQALGVEENLKIDSKRYDLLRGDTLLLCSDGLSGMVKDAEMERIVLEEADLVAAGRKLIEAANAGGGKDNITVILARFDGEGLREPLTPLSDAEKTGVSFKAPPPPKSPAGRNAVIATAAVLGVIGMAILWPKPTSLVVTVSHPAELVLRPAAEGGPAGVGEVAKTALADAPVTFEVGTKGAYEIVPNAPGFQSEPTSVTVRGDVREISLKIQLVRIPAKTLDIVPPPYKGRGLDKVRVQLTLLRDGLGNAPPPTEVKDKEEFTNFPAGVWKADVTRDGFADASVEFTVDSGVDARLELPAMEERFGVLDLKDAWEGSTVTVFDGEEQLLDPPVAVLATGRAEVKVRATKVAVVVTREGAREFRQAGFEIAAGKTTELTLREHKGRVSFALGPNQEVRLKGGGIFSSPDGIDLRPGTYTGTFNPGGGQRTMNIHLVLHPGEIREKIDPASLAAEK